MTATAPPPRRDSSGQLQFAAVNRALERMHGALTDTLERHAEASRLRIDAWAYMPESEYATIANFATGHASSAVSLAHELGVAEGRAAVLAELGYPAEGRAGPDDITQKLAPCPLDPQQPCPVPARAAARKDPPR